MPVASIPLVLAGQYRTDGEKLYRLVKVKGDTATLEDALTLECERLPLRLVMMMRLVKGSDGDTE